MEPLAALVTLPIACLLALGCLSSRIANAKSAVLRQLVTWMAAGECTIALILAFGYTASGTSPLAISLTDRSHALDVSFGIYFDGATSLMLLLVSFVGFVVSRFSVRYLNGEATQGRYFRWLGFTIGAVSLMVVAGNLMLFFVAWVMTSFGLHQLLLHYRHRAAAHRAAWTKFAISRLGDTFLIAALVLTFKAFGTFELAELFAKASELAGGSQATAVHAAIGWLLVLGAATKSAQFPFHTWLPDTMETPTPVSALMHAGIVNAGGYLIIRMSPLVALAPAALATLAAIGALTACYAGIVMMTQPSVKRQLAYSTIAQMGFMMLQCGLGAFSAAMLHILAHSLYKAHAFLNSGSVVSQSLAATGAKSPNTSPRVNVACVLAATAVTVVAYFGITFAFGIDSAAKPGGLVLALVLCLALTTWGWRLFTLGESRTMLVGLAGITGLCLAYVASYLAVDQLLGTTITNVAIVPSLQWLLAAIACAFCVLFALQVVINRRVTYTWLQPLRVHAANGFYVDALYQRVITSLVKT